MNLDLIDFKKKLDIKESLVPELQYSYGKKINLSATINQSLDKRFRGLIKQNN